MKTNIQWCDYTWNPWRGCTKVSPGCANCYAEKLVTTRLRGQWGKGKPRTMASEKILADPFRWNKRPWICDVCGRSSDRHYDHSCTGRKEDTCHTDNVTWHRARVFSLSLGDWLDPEVPIEWLAKMLDTIQECDQIDWLLCTKRPELFKGRVKQVIKKNGKSEDTIPLSAWLGSWLEGRPRHNVWVLTSTENQEMLDKRAARILEIPAVVHGLSCEPLLGPLNFGSFLGGIDWVIAGGESGPNARPCQVDWLRSIQEQCAAAGVAYFCKQFGFDPRQDLSAAIPEADITDPELDPADIAAWELHRHSVPLHLADRKGGTMDQWPDASMRVREWPNAIRSTVPSIP